MASLHVSALPVFAMQETQQLCTDLGARLMPLIVSHDRHADRMYAVHCHCRATRKDVERALAGGRGSMADTLRLLEAS
jgi:hypothetical protein